MRESQQITAQQALEWCQKHPGWMRICDAPGDYDSRYYRHGYIIFGSRFIGYRQIHERQYDWVWEQGFMLVCKPL